MPYCEAFSTSYGFFRMVYGAGKMEVISVACERLKMCYLDATSDDVLNIAYQ